VKILLDECVPWPLSRHIKNHQCSSPKKEGWGGITNGDLLARAENKFDAFITSDQSLRYQQNLAGRKLAILELWTNDWQIIQAQVKHIVPVVENLKLGDFIIFRPSD